MKKAFLFTFIIVAISAFATRMLSFFLPLYFDELGFNGFEIGVFFSAMAVAGLVIAFPSGILNDRLDSRILILVGILLTALHLFGLSLSKSFIPVLIFMFIYGIGDRLFKLSTDSYILKKVIDRKGFRYGLYDGIRCIAAAIGIFIGGNLLFNFKISLLLSVAGLIILLSIPLLRFLPKTDISFQKLNLYISDIMHRRTLIFLSLLFIFTLHWGVESTVYSLFLQENLGLTTAQMGLFMSLPIIGLGAFAIYIGNKYDKGLSLKKLFFLAFMLSGFGLAMMAITNNVYLSFFFRVIHELGDGAFVVFMFVGASSYFPKVRMGGGYGFVMLVTVISAMVSSLIFSPVGDIFGYHIPHIIVGALVFLAGFFVFLFRR